MKTPTKFLHLACVALIFTIVQAGKKFKFISAKSITFDRSVVDFQNCNASGTTLLIDAILRRTLSRPIYVRTFL